MRVLVYNRADSPLFEILPSELYGLVRTEELNGPRSLTVTTTRVLAKNYRVLMVDATGRWREYVVEGVDEEHGKGAKPIGTYWCSWSMQHDLELTVVSHIPTNASVSTALGDALDGTARWSKGTITATGTATASMYEMSGWQAIGVLCENWGCEVDDQIGVDTKGVVTRKCAALSQVGSSTAKRRFDYGTDVKSIKRKVSEEPVYARVIPKGMGEETDTGYYGRRIGIESVNNNIPYLQNNDTAGSLRVPDGNGGYEYPTCYVVNSEMDTPAKLKAWAQDNLAEWTVPKVTYSADVSQFARAGLDPKGVQLGDAVQVVDSSFGSKGLRIEARVVALSINELDPADMKLTIGDAPASLSTGLTSLDGSITSIKSTVMAINGGTMATADYLGRLVDRLNYSINATGGFTYLVPGHGMLTFDVAVADPLNPVEASQVVEVKGGSIRIADSKTAQGEWEWKTVFTSGHIAGDLVTAAAITTGYIGSSSGTFIDLDNGIAQFGDTSGTWTQVATNAFNVRQGATDVLATFGSNGSRIGKYDESHLDMDSRNINLIDEFGYSYFKMSDLRNYAGWASLNEVFYGNGTKTQFDVSFSVYIVFGVRVDGVSVSFTPPASSSSRTVTLDAAPSSGAEIVIAYSTESEFAKAFTIGRRNTDASIGGYSYAEGFDVDASGSYSHAEGRDTHSVGIGSHAEGNETEARGDDSHAEGHWTQARGAHSHSEGFFSVASGDNSHAQNRYTVAASTDQTAIGRMNVEDANGTYALIVGNGDQLQGTRSNALTVDWDGNVAAGNTVTLGTNTSAEENGIRVKGGGTRNEWMLRNISAANGDGDAVLLGNGGATVIGSGEAHNNLWNALGLSAGTEQLHLASGGNAYVWSNCGTIENRARAIFTTTNSGTYPQTFCIEGGQASPLAVSNNANNGWTTTNANGTYSSIQLRDKGGYWTGVFGSYVVGSTTAAAHGANCMYIGARNKTTSNTDVANYINLYVRKDGTRTVSVSDAAAWRTALQGAREILKSSTLDRDDATDPSAAVWSNSDVYFYDKDDESLGYIRVGRSTTGSMMMRLQVNNEPFGGGTAVNNYIEIGVRRDGTRRYTIGDPAAFREAIDMNTWTTVSLGDFATAASGWAFSTSNCNVQYNEALGALRVRIQITTSAAQTAGQKTLFTVKTAYRPKTFAASLSSLTAYAQAGQIYTTGGFAVNISAISASTSLYFNGVYFIGA